MHKFLIGVAVTVVTSFAIVIIEYNRFRVDWAKAFPPQGGK